MRINMAKSCVLSDWLTGMSVPGKVTVCGKSKVKLFCTRRKPTNIQFFSAQSHILNLFGLVYVLLVRNSLSKSPSFYAQSSTVGRKDVCGIISFPEAALWIVLPVPNRLF